MAKSSVRVLLVALPVALAACGGSRASTQYPPAAPFPAPLVARPLQGPHATFADLCVSIAPPDEGTDEPVRCGRGEADPPAGTPDEVELELVVPPWRAVKLVGVLRGTFGQSAAYHLALRTQAGWHVTAEALADVYNPGAFGIAGEVEVETFELRELVPGDPPEVFLALSHHRRDSDMGVNEVEFLDRKLVVVCGVGPSGVPACFDPIVTEHAHERTALIEGEDAEVPEAADYEPRRFSESWRVDLRFRPDGVLEMTRLEGAGDEAPAGTYSLVLP